MASIVDLHALDARAAPASASVTRRWISAFSGQPAMVRRMVTAHAPAVPRATSPTMPRSTMLRCSSGSVHLAQGRHHLVRASAVAGAHMNILAQGSASPSVTPQGPWPG